jgi:hypothetical protein
VLPWRPPDTPDCGGGAPDGGWPGAGARPYDDRVSVRADRRQIPWATLVVMLLAGAGAWWATGASWLAIVVAVVAGWLILKAGFAVLSSLATPLPPPPPAGELRKVRLVYRCSLCGTEVRMTSANDEVPEPPRHCMEDMDLVTSLDDI